MCGCEACVICNEQQRSLNHWHGKKLRREKDNLANERRGRSYQVLRETIEKYQSEIKDGEKHVHRRMWDAAECISCGDVPGQSLPHHSCIIGKCETCNIFKVPLEELECEEPITYNVYRRVDTCSIHGLQFLVRPDESKSKVICTECENMTEMEKAQHKPKPKIKTHKNRIMIREKKKYFMAPGGQYQKSLRKMKFHKYHVKILGKYGCMKGREEEAVSDPSVVSTNRDHGENYQVSADGQIQSEYYAKDQDLSMEGVSVKYYPKDSGGDRTHVFYSYLSDEKHQNAATVAWNIADMSEDLTL